MAKCGIQWRAPWLPPPNLDKIDRDYFQKHRANDVCVLDLGHEGGHRSRSNVIADNDGPGPVSYDEYHVHKTEDLEKLFGAAKAGNTQFGGRE